MLRRQTDDVLPDYYNTSDFRSRDWQTNQSAIDTLVTTVATETSTRDQGGLGAGYYVIVVILVYGLSIVLLIGSHIKRKKAKIVEDQQINKYLEEVQVLFLHCYTVLSPCRAALRNGPVRTFVYPSSRSGQ